MKIIVIVSTLLATTLASVHFSSPPVTFYNVVDPLPHFNHVHNTYTGEYLYSYSGGPSAKSEAKSIDGVTRGSYNYVDANGIIQEHHYIADDNGFRVAGTDIPSESYIPPDAPDVAAAKISHFAEHQKATGKLSRKKRSAILPPSSNFIYSSGYPQKFNNRDIKSLIPTVSESNFQIRHDRGIQNIIPGIPSAFNYFSHPVHPSVISSAPIPIATSRQRRYQVINREKAYFPVNLLAPAPQPIYSTEHFINTPAITGQQHLSNEYFPAIQLVNGDKPLEVQIVTKPITSDNGIVNHIINNNENINSDHVIDNNDDAVVVESA